MKTLKNVLPRAAIIFLIFTLLCGVVYTGIVTGIAQLIFPDKANGSIIEVDGKKYGCELLGQQYKDDGHMWGRIMNIDVSTYKDENGKTQMLPLGNAMIEGKLIGDFQPSWNDLAFAGFSKSGNKSRQ